MGLDVSRVDLRFVIIYDVTFDLGELVLQVELNRFLFRR
jgi:hypothetical protein